MRAQPNQPNATARAAFCMLLIAALFVFCRSSLTPLPVLETRAATPVSPLMPVPMKDSKSCPLVPSTSKPSAETINELRSMHMQFPIDGVSPDTIKGSFYQKRGCELHEAADVVVPRNTPVRAINDGIVAKLYNSKAGGITLYEYDPSKRYVFYYAHLERYADGIKDGDIIKRGQIIAYVGDSGDAKAAGPHLHFSIAKLANSNQWWSGKGNYIDPYEVFKR